MSGTPHGRARTAFWKTAGLLLRALRERQGWSEAEFAARAGVSVDLVRSYELTPERFPAVEAWWRMTTALGVDLVAFLRQVEQRAGTTLLLDVRPPVAPTRPTVPARPTAELKPTSAGAPTHDALRGFVDQLQGEAAPGKPPGSPR